MSRVLTITTDQARHAWQRVMHRLAERSERVPSRSRHWQVLIICAGALLFMLTMEVQHGEKVALESLSRFPLPELCMSRVWFDVACPGCGLTRSCIALAHGDVSASLGYHRLGWMMALLIAVQVPYRIVALQRPRWLEHVWWSRLTFVLGLVVITALIGNWTIDLLPK